MVDNVSVRRSYQVKASTQVNTRIFPEKKLKFPVAPGGDYTIVRTAV
jgi:hypothetical protein